MWLIQVRTKEPVIYDMTVRMSLRVQPQTNFHRQVILLFHILSFIQFIWYMMCAFQIVWTLYGGYYLIHEVTKRSVYWNEEDQLVYFYGFLIAAMVLDVFIAGSEIIHKLYHDQLIRKQKNIEREQEAIENSIIT